MIHDGDGVREPHRLRAGALGTASITFFVVSAAAPIVAIAGGFPLGMMFGDGAGFAGMLLLCMGILLLFAAGYTAMARHAVSAGGFYSLVARGLGGTAGGGAAMIGLIAYNAMQIGLYGMFGVALRNLLLDYGGVDLPWYLYCALAWACIAVLGYRQVDLSAKILSVLVVAEYIAVLVLDGAILRKGGAHGINLRSFGPLVLSGTPSIGFLFCFAGFMGFEATTIYGEEARNPERTVPRATYFAVLLIGLFYALSMWCLTLGQGVDQLVPHLKSLTDITSFMFDLATRYVGHWLSATMSVLFVTSIFAGLLAFHNAASRYFFALGREGLLPAALGRTHGAHQSPHIGSLLQSALAFVVVAIFAITRSDPVLTLFSWLTNLGTLGIIAAMGLAAAAVPVFFWRRPDIDPGLFRGTLAPVISCVALWAIFALANLHFNVLTGSEGVWNIVLPGLVEAAAVVGVARARQLRFTAPARFSALGFGGSPENNNKAAQAAQHAEKQSWINH